MKIFNKNPIFLNGLKKVNQYWNTNTMIENLTCENINIKFMSIYKMFNVKENLIFFLICLFCHLFVDF